MRHRDTTKVYVKVRPFVSTQLGYSDEFVVASGEKYLIFLIFNNSSENTVSIIYFNRKCFTLFQHAYITNSKFRFNKF